MEGQNVKNVINNTNKNNNNGKLLAVIENNTEKPQKQVNDNDVINK